jgi:hypothetical protein
MSIGNRPDVPEVGNPAWARRLTERAVLAAHGKAPVTVVRTNGGSDWG